MRKALLLLCSALMVSAGCGGGDDSSTDTSSSPPVATSITGVAVGGDFGSKPDVAIDAPVTVDETTVDTLSAGDGAAVATGDTVVFDYVGLLGRTGDQFDSSYDRGVPATSTTKSLLPGLAKAVEGQTVGSRVVVAVAPLDGFGPQGGVPDVGIEKDDTLVFVVDILGAPQFKPTGIDGVELAEFEKQPLLKVDAPLTVDKTQVEVLTDGTGPTVSAGDQVTVNYVGVNGRTGGAFDNSYSRGQPATFGTDGVVKGFAKALKGSAVGSRVVVAMTSEDGYGAGGNPQIGVEGGDPLVFVIDILDTQTPPSASPSASPSKSPSASPS